MRVALLLTLLATACDGECIDGICPDTDNTRKHPGPCLVASDKQDLRGTFEYDEQGRLVRTTTSSRYRSETASSNDHTDTTWTYDGDELAGIVVRGWSGVSEMPAVSMGTTTWQFFATEVHEVAEGCQWNGHTQSYTCSLAYSRIYDRSVFSLFTLGWMDRLPYEQLGLLNDNGRAVTTTIEGSKRTQTKTFGYTVSSTFELDGKRILSIEQDYNTEQPGIDEWQTFTYDGDRLIERRIDFNFTDLPYVWTPTFDAAGNLVAEESIENDSTFHTVYDYRCW